MARAKATARAVPTFPNLVGMQVKDLEVLAGKLNPAVGYYNPTSLAEMEFWGQTQEATIGFLRASEIKHGRVAMAAFVGFCVQAQGIHFPWDLTLSGVSFGDISAAGSPLEQWDALPTTSKLSLFLSLGFLEWWGENTLALGASGAFVSTGPFEIGLLAYLTLNLMWFKFTIIWRYAIPPIPPTPAPTYAELTFLVMF